MRFLTMTLYIVALLSLTLILHLLQLPLEGLALCRKRPALKVARTGKRFPA